MAIELEGLEFQIEAKSEEGTKGIDALTASLGKLKQATKGGLGLNSKVKELNKLNEALKGFHTDKLESLGKALASLNGLGKTQISSTIPKRLNEIAQSLHEIGLSDIERLKDLSKALSDLQEVGGVKIPKVTVPSAGVAPTMNGTTNAEAATSGVEQATSNVQKATSAVNGFKAAVNKISAVTGIAYPFKQIGQALSSVPGKIKQVLGHLRELRTEFEKSGGVVGAFGRMMGNIFKKSAAGMAAGMKAVTSTLAKKLLPTTKKTTGALGRLVGAFKRVALYRMIRFVFSQLVQTMKEGINNLYQYSNAMGGTFAQSMDRLATSASYLKNSLAAMAAPIINALAPAIDFLINKIVTLLNYINMLFARLSGASVFTAAKKSATSYGDALSGAGGSAASAAKEIRDATTGIDELNMIMQKDNSGGGGGGGGADYGSMFEKLPIDNSVSEFADKLKAAFKAADWKGLSTILGDKVNEMIDSVDWEGVGSKIGYWLNAAVQTAYYFLDTVNFTKIGTHVGELINSGLAEIDFTYWGRTLVKVFTLLPDFLIGALTELDWGLVGKSIGDFIIGAFDEAIDWLNKYDWSELGATFRQNIKDLLTGIDWSGVVSSLFTGLGITIRSLGQFLGGFFGSIAGDIKNWLNEDIMGTDWKETVGNLLNAIGEGFTNIGTWVRENIIEPFGEALLGEKWDDVKKVGSNLLGKVKEGWDKVCSLAKNVGQFFVNVKNNAVSWWNNVKTWWSDKVGAVKDFTTNVTNNVSTWWSNVKTWWSGKVGAVQNFTTNVANQASMWWNNVKTWWSGVVGAVQNFTTNVANQASMWWNNVKTWWSDKVGAVKEFTTTVTNQSSMWWNSVKTWWSGVVGKLTVGVAIKNEATTWWNNVKRWWNDTIGDLWTTLNIKIPTISVKWSTIRVFGKDYSYPSGFNLTWNAKGGILDGAQIFGMLGNSFLGGGEAGKEAVLPLETHTEWMDTLAEKVRSGLPDNDTGGMEYGEFKRALADFYTEYVQGTMSQMASDMNRQANKKEHTTVQVGNRVITDAVREQENANGYRFTTA